MIGAVEDGQPDTLAIGQGLHLLNQSLAHLVLAAGDDQYQGLDLVLSLLHI